MQVILVTIFITTLGFGGLVTLRFGLARNKLALMAGSIVALATFALLVLFVALSTNRIDSTPWLDLQLVPLGKQAAGLSIGVAVLWTIYLIIPRLVGAERPMMEAAILGILILGLGGFLMIGVRLTQESPPLDEPGIPASPDFPTLPDVMESDIVKVERTFPSLSFRRPTNLVQAPDDNGLIFVTEQRGHIRVFSNDPDATQSDSFLDITDRVYQSGEGGLFGLAFDPEYRRNGYFYVNYVASDRLNSRLSRFSVSQEDPTRADPSTEFVVLEIPRPNPTRHLGGQLAFGPDGYLYIGVGDGGIAHDIPRHAQNTRNLLGTILRIDVSALSEQERYRIPMDNPFVGDPEARDEIWAYGLRNPWRFSFDEETGRLWAADVGATDWEEIDLVESGLNYGWNFYEGAHCFSEIYDDPNNYDPPVGCDQVGLQLPVSEYSHDEGGCAVVGGYVYRGKKIPSLAGGYVYGDYCSGKIWAQWYDGDKVTRRELLVDTELLIG